MKKVLHINNGLTGGPGRFMYNVCLALEKDVENIIIVPRIERNSIFQNNKYKIIEICKKDFYFSRVLSKFFQYTSNVLIQKDGFWPEVFCRDKSKIILKKINGKVDIIILYWYKNFIAPNSLLNLFKKTKAKIYIYLMDEAAMTGGCHYKVNCNNFQSGCGNCSSVLNGKINKDITFFRAKENKEIFEKIGVRIICPTTTSLLDVKSSKILTNLKHELLLGYLPSNYYKQKENDKKDKKIFIGAQNLKNYRKGGKLLLGALEIVVKKLTFEERNKIVLYIVGNNIPLEFEKLGFKIQKLGFLNNEELIKTYQKCDVFISASIVDMGPMMINEAIASGTPVVSFDVGVAKDLVINYETGFIAESISEEALAKEILNFIFLDEDKIRTMNKLCLKMYKEKLSYSKYKEKLKEILEI